MRRDIEFPSGGSRCRGWLYVPDTSAVKQPAPTIVMAHGFSAVKEMFHLSSYAERFEAAGFVVLVFDFRFLGASEGNPRGQIISHEQQEGMHGIAKVEVDERLLIVIWTDRLLDWLRLLVWKWWPG